MRVRSLLALTCALAASVVLSSCAPVATAPVATASQTPAVTPSVVPHTELPTAATGGAHGITPSPVATLAPAELEGQVLSAVAAFLRPLTSQRLVPQPQSGPGVTPVATPDFGDLVVTLRDHWDDRALVMIGPAYSEWANEIGLHRQSHGSWCVDYVDGLPTDPANVNTTTAETRDLLNALSTSEGFTLGSTPGTYKASVAMDEKGAPTDPGVVLVAPYGQHWQWRYTLRRGANGYQVVSKEPANEPGAVTNCTQLNGELPAALR